MDVHTTKPKVSRIAARFRKVWWVVICQFSSGGILQEVGCFFFVEHSLLWRHLVVLKAFHLWVCQTIIVIGVHTWYCRFGRPAHWAGSRLSMPVCII